MGFEMTSGVSGDSTNGFYVAMQWIRETTQANRINVPIDGIAAGRFRSLENAFDASFDRMRTAIDRQVSTHILILRHIFDSPSLDRRAAHALTRHWKE
jgi:hypothetical protein